MLDGLRRAIAGLIAPETRTLGISPRIDPAFYLGLVGGGRATHAGPTVNEATAFGVTAFWRAVNIYASTIAALSLDVVERHERGGFAPALGHPIQDLIHSSPNRTTDRVHFWEAIIAHALTFKGGYAEIEWSRGNRRALGLHLMDPRSVTPIFNDDRSVSYRIDRDGTSLDSSDVVHVRGLSFSGIEGYSLVEVARQTFGVSLAQLVYEGSVFGNGATMGGVMEMPGKLDTAQAADFRANWNQVHQGAQNAGKVGVLWGGAKFVPTNYSPVDAELIAARAFAVKEFSRLTGVPLHMLAEMDGATVGNAEQQALQFVKFSLLPWIKRIEAELDHKLFSREERRRYSVRHDTKSLERGDLAARTSFNTAMFDRGVLSDNEWRLSEGMEPLKAPAADWHWIPTNNLAPIEKMGDNPPATQPASNQPPEPDPDGTDADPAGAAEDDPEAPAP